MGWCCVTSLYIPVQYLLDLNPGCVQQKHMCRVNGSFDRGNRQDHFCLCSAHSLMLSQKQAQITQSSMELKLPWEHQGWARHLKQKKHFGSVRTESHVFQAVDAGPRITQVCMGMHRLCGICSNLQNCLTPYLPAYLLPPLLWIVPQPPYFLPCRTGICEGLLPGLLSIAWLAAVLLQ